MQVDVAVIGGGAAGFVAAIMAKKHGKSVAILERKDRVLKKVLATGNGRCNYTNINANISNYYGENSSFIKEVLENFTVKDTIKFFEEIGIVPKIEERGKVYPYSGQASSIVDVLRRTADYLGIESHVNFNVVKIVNKSSDFRIYSEDSKSITAKKVILAAGGQASPELGSNGSGYKLAKELGHEITELRPALVQLKTEKEPIKGLEGIKVNSKINVFSKDKLLASDEGELLFTNYGISGSVVFNLSHVVALYDRIKFIVDFMPDYNVEEIEELLKKRQEKLSYLTMENYLTGVLNKKLGQLLLKRAGIEKLSFLVSKLDKTMISKIAELIKNYEIKVIETTGFKNAQVTAGGVKTNDINPKTMESYKIKGIYFIGEILDVFGDCGGYNLQWAWATGYLAGNNIASKE